jgi:hypothetical protein
VSEKPVKPAVPPGTGPRGRRLWKEVNSEFWLEEHELTLLREAVRTVDQLDKLDVIVRREGLVLGGKQERKVHPAAIEARQLRLVLARVLAALRLPSGLSGKSPQRRVGVRGTYSPVRSIA